LKARLDDLFELIVLIPQISAPGRTMYLCHPVSIFRTSATFQTETCGRKGHV